MKRTSGDSSAKGLLLQICQSALSNAVYKSGESRDFYMGPVAVTAVFMRNSSLFAKAVQRTAKRFDKDSYSTLGELICLQDSVISEDELVSAALSPNHY